MTDADKKALIG